jgi:hypothetical protein
MVKVELDFFNKRRQHSDAAFSLSGIFVTMCGFGIPIVTILAASSFREPKPKVNLHIAPLDHSPAL